MFAVRPAEVAGMFYPRQPAALRAEIAGFLDAVAPPAEGRAAPKMVVAPHAGTVYSGPIAAHAYARLAGARGCVTRVVLLAPAHRIALRGLAAPAASAFETPLGTMPIAATAVQTLVETMPQVHRSDRAHEREHSIEVQLPFLQAVLGDVEIVPLLVGDASPAEVAQVLELLWGGDETLIVISSDLSHYLPYADAQAIDRATAQRIVDFDATIDHDEACGATPINGALIAARSHGLQPRLLDLRNSGDTVGDRDRVVGYCAIEWTTSAGKGHGNG